jgi:hypothetical protein
MNGPETSDVNLRQRFGFKNEPGLPSEIQKSEEVRRLVKGDRQGFTAWLSHHSNPTLNIPVDAARYMVIPQKIYELMDDPISVEINVQEARDKALGVGVSYKDSLRKRIMRRVNHKPQTKSVLSASFVSTQSEAGKILYTKEFVVAEELRRKGIGTAFNERLRNVAKELGFWVLTGQNESREKEGSNLPFFTDKLGRVVLSQIKPEYRHLFEPNYSQMEPSLAASFTVDFLNPEDREKYLQDQYLPAHSVA